MVCDAIKTEDEHACCRDRNELFQIIKTMEKFSLFSKNGAIAQSYVNHAARIIDQTFAEKSRQTILGETKLICWSSGKNIYKGRSAK